MVTEKDFNTLLSKKVNFDAEGHVTNINTSGLVTESGFAKMFSERAEADGYVKKAEISTFITEDDAGRLISNAKIRADQIDLVGAVTIKSLASDVLDSLNSKLSAGDFGSLAFQNAVEVAQLGSTIVVGGYLNTDLIKVRRIDADAGFIGGFRIEHGILHWKSYDYFGNDSRSLKLGVSETDTDGIVDVSFNAATEGRFGIKAVGSNEGGAAIYASSKSSGQSYPNTHNTYAGYFDGEVYVKGSVSSELCLAEDFGCIKSKNADGTISYYKGVDLDFGSLKFRKGLLVATA